MPGDGEVDHQERKNLQIPRNVPGGGGGAWQEDKLNYALTDRGERRKGVAVKQITKLTQISR